MSVIYLDMGHLAQYKDKKEYRIELERTVRK